MVFLHGFLGHTSDWRAIRSLLGFSTSSYPLPGHDRPPLNEPMSLAGLAADFDQYFQSLETPKSTVVGYSLGGRIALSWALNRPPKKLILISTAPGLHGQNQSERLQSDAAWIEVLENEPKAFAQKWTQQPLFGPAPDERRVADIDSADLSSAKRILAEASPAQNPELWTRLPELKCDVVYLCGENDRKYLEIGHRIVDCRPTTKVITVPSAYHDLHRTHPEFLAEVLKQERI